MSSVPLFELALKRRKRLLSALGFGLIAFGALIVLVAGAIPADQLLSAKPAPASLDAFSGSSGQVALASVAGLLGAGLLHPFWIAMQLSAVASLGAAVLAGDVEDGTIELIAARPVSRTRLFLERTAAGVLAAALLCLVAIVPYAVGAVVSQTVADALTPSGLLVAALSGFCLTFFFVGLAVAASCIAKRRAAVFGIVGGIGAAAYAINFIAEAWSTLRFARKVSPFHYYRPADALVGSAFPWVDVLVLTGGGVVLLVIGWWALQKRELV